MFEIIPMTEKWIDAVTEVEKACFSIPWTKKDFEREVKENKMAVYFVAVEKETVLGYAGMWHVINEGHITNVAVKEEYRGQKIGAALVKRLIEEAQKREMIGITLEVKITNIPAQKLYTKYGFRPEGIRKKYYQDTGEDAVIMWKYFENYEDFEKVR